MKRARDDIADAGHRSAAPACFADDVAFFLSLSCGGSSSGSEEAAGTCTALPPPSGCAKRARCRRRGRDDDDAFECRTCGRQFATFQALGGHRTSHLRRPMTKHHRPKRVMVHTCAMCGMGFSTGQALGGHMRRHSPRPPTTTEEHSGGNVGLAQINLFVHKRPSSASLQLLNLFV